MQTEVYCDGCKDSHYTKELEILGVEKNPESHDVMTFFCEKSQFMGISSVRTRSATKSGGWF